LALKPSFFGSAPAGVSPSPCWAETGVKIKREKTLKTATVKDLISLDLIPALKFAAKIRVYP